MSIISKDEFYEDNLEDVLEIINKHISEIDITTYKETGEIVIPIVDELAELHENVIASIADILEDAGWEVTLEESEEKEVPSLLILA
jgi:hypothetical protein